MNRLDTVLPEWTRRAWTSYDAQCLWEPRITAIGAAWDDAEISSIGKGHRISALRFCAPGDLPALTARMASKGLSVVPLGQSPIAGSSYSSSGAQYMGGDFVYRIAITDPSNIEEWIDVWVKSNDVAIGRLLGFPKCCQEFFQDVWVLKNYLDTSWPMAMNSVDEGNATREGDVITIPAVAPLESNILLRWSGVRAVAHLPCSFHCGPTRDVGVLMLNEVFQAGFPQEAQWMRELLEMPMEWSTLHGIAEIKTPLFTVSTRSDLTRTKYVIRVENEHYPEEGATGLVFPYQGSQGNALTEGKSFAASIARFKQDRDAGGATLWEDNGFSDEAGMDAAHAVIRNVFLRDAERNKKMYDNGRILDLGCGNGRLVLSLMEFFPCEPCGIDTDSAAIARAYASAPDGHWSVGDIRDKAKWPGSVTGYNLVLFMPGRLDEWEKEDVEYVLTELATLTKHVLIYCYGDWIEKGGLRAIVDRHPTLAAWWGQKENIVQESGVEAVVVTV